MKILSSLLLAILITGGAVVARAIDDEMARQTLKGLKGVSVIVEDLKPEVESAGLTKASIQTDVELKLRLAGIPVDAAFSPYLYVDGFVLPMSDGSWPYHINVELKQRVLLHRDRSIVGYASTWSVAEIGRINKANVHTLRNYIKDLVDKFIDAYLSVNPK